MQTLEQRGFRTQEWEGGQRQYMAAGRASAPADSPQKTRSRSKSRPRPRPSIESPRDLPAPEAHLPLRKASAHRLHNRKGGVPRPLFAPSGISPSPVQPLPHIDNFTASSEHAFAGRDARRPFKPPMGVFYNQQQFVPQQVERDPNQYDRNVRPPSSPLHPPHPLPHSPTEHGKRLKASKSLGDGLRTFTQRVSSGTSLADNSGNSTSDGVSPRPSVIKTGGVRESYRSALTSHSSFAPTSSINTDRSSLTGNSTHSDFTKPRPEDWQDNGDVDMSVEDAIGMYEDGFDSAVKQSFDVQSVRSIDRPKISVEVRSSRALERPASQPDTQQEPSKRPNYAHRRSQSATMLLGVSKPQRPEMSRQSSLEPPTLTFEQRTSMQIISNDMPDSRPNSTAPSTVPRDRYGFKKATQHTTVAQYDAWNTNYSAHLERRSKKWHALMRSYGLSTSEPFRFPPKSDKIKRYVRKGIPPEFRGAAWFWYAGGPGKLAAEQGLYLRLVEGADKGLLGDTDREHIERDLNRTFPDNVRFKPDPTPTLDMQAGTGGGNAQSHSDDTTNPAAKQRNKRSTPDSEPETPILQALRRVLQAFAIHNPNIGYCQSLNFIAGLLLLFLDQDEEKAFILLNIVTTQHLPGTHGVALEGANIDIAVLMSCIKDSLPAVWSKLDDKGGGPLSSTSSDPSAALRLPTVSLATTAWFMSLFVGTLPIECVLRVWDCLFFEGSKTLFRIALAIFKAGEPQILRIQDPMEIFQVVQSIPRAMLDVNGLLDVCFRRRGGFGGISQGLIEGRREERRRFVKQGVSRVTTSGMPGSDLGFEDAGRLRRLTRKVRSRTAK